MEVLDAIPVAVVAGLLYLRAADVEKVKQAEARHLEKEYHLASYCRKFFI